jgi:hypothetical protein
MAVSAAEIVTAKTADLRIMSNLDEEHTWQVRHNIEPQKRRDLEPHKQPLQARLKGVKEAPDVLCGLASL